MTKEICNGYTVFTPDPLNALPGQGIMLIDMDGNIVHEWSIFGQATMLPGGAVFGGRGEQGNDEESHKGDTGAFIQESWDGKAEWSFSDWDDDGSGVKRARQHHDFQREGNPVGYYAPGQEFMPQGNTLILAHKNKMMPEISELELIDDVIYEVDWQGGLTGFEWHGSDHFKEMGFDDTAVAAIKTSPRVRPGRNVSDWIHINCLSLLGKNRWFDDTGDERFSPDNMMIGSRNANFVAIISRASGDIVWKLGPDFIDGRPEYGLGQFVGQHHAHMIPDRLPGAGNILVFDNGGTSGYGGPEGYPRYSREFSRIVEFNPVTLEIIWEYGKESGEEYFYSHFISSAQRLPNGNTMITEGSKGHIFEVNSDKKIVWEFVSPVIGKKGNPVYRASRIPPEWVPGNPAGYAEWGEVFNI